MMTETLVSLYKLHKRQFNMELPLIFFSFRTHFPYNKRDFSKKCKRVRLENGAEFLKRQRLFTDVTSDRERHFHFRAIGRDFEDV